MITEKDTIIFDIFGVLLRPNPLIPLTSLDMKSIVRYYIHHKKSPISQALDLIEKMPEFMPDQKCHTLKYKDRFLPVIFDQWQKGTVSRDELSKTLVQYLDQLEQCNYFPKKNDMRTMAQLIHYFSKPPKSPYTLMHYSSMVRVIKKLKQSGKYRLFILSNLDKETYAHIMKYHSALTDLFDGIIASCEVAQVKPEDAIFQTLISSYKIDPKKSLFIDDQEENCLAADKAGMETILCDSIRNTVRQLKTLL